MWYLIVTIPDLCTLTYFYTFQAISTWEDGRLKTIIKPIDSSKKEQLVVREIVDGEMIQVCVDAHRDG